MNPATGAVTHTEHLIVAGSGICAVRQMTLETIDAMRQADKVLYVVSDDAGEALVHSLNPAGAESLMRVYEEGKPRHSAHEAMIAAVLGNLRAGRRVCFLVYGHPGVFVWPAHESIRLARQEGFSARMLPGVSADACFIADMGIDAGCGMQSFEATDFLRGGRHPDPFAHLLLWQIGGLGDASHRTSYNPRGVADLTSLLLNYYNAWHVIYLYEAASEAGRQPVITPGYLCHLPGASIPPHATLYIPPARVRA